MSDFRSKLASYIQGLIEEQHAMGFLFNEQEQILRRFDKFIIDNEFDTGELDNAVVSLWEERLPTEKDSARNGRLQAVNKLAEYMQQLGVAASFCHTMGKAFQPIQYIPSEAEMAKILIHVDNLDCVQPSLKRLCAEYSVMIRLYYFCGLRLNEAVMLKREDVNLYTGRLYIKKSKGDKDRYVFAAEDLRCLLLRYDEYMEHQVPSREWFFPGFYKDEHFCKTTIDRKFREWWITCFPAWSGKRPTIHSLRHAFVVNRINEWAKDEMDFKLMVPFLSKYLGHSSIGETYYYYSMRNPRETSIRTMMEKGSIAREVDLE